MTFPFHGRRRKWRLLANDHQLLSTTNIDRYPNGLWSFYIFLIENLASEISLFNFSDMIDFDYYILIGIGPNSHLS